MSALVIGIDPGPIPGLVRLEVAGGRILRRDVVQCTHLIAPDVLKGLLFRFDATVQLVAIERFVVSGRSGRSGTASAGETTRNLIGALENEAQRAGAQVVLRSASEVKPWATDARIEAAGLHAPTKAMRHARDACRHALYAAARARLIADPLSNDYKTRNALT